MESRLDRQNHEETRSRLDRQSRTDKNHDLYEDLYTNGNYTGIADITNKAIVELETIDNKFKTRESYHQIKEYQDIIKTPNNIKKDDLSIFFMEDDKKSYDINDIIESAKKNRETPDELEIKRKLTNTQYDILSDLKLERHENKEGKEEQLQELINTITSKGLREDIEEAKNKELLIELLPTSTNTITVSSSKAILEENTNAEDALEENIDIDHNFFSKSLEISKKELESDDELKDLDKGSSVVFKILVALIFVIIIATATIFIINNI